MIINLNLKQINYLDGTSKFRLENNNDEFFADWFVKYEFGLTLFEFTKAIYKYNGNYKENVIIIFDSKSDGEKFINWLESTIIINKLSNKI